MLTTCSLQVLEGKSIEARAVISSACSRCPDFTGFRKAYQRFRATEGASWATCPKRHGGSQAWMCHSETRGSRVPRRLTLGTPAESLGNEPSDPAVDRDKIEPVSRKRAASDCVRIQPFSTFSPKRCDPRQPWIRISSALPSRVACELMRHVPCCVTRRKKLPNNEMESLENGRTGDSDYRWVV
jgi:hypothetical protein